jgi:adenylate kinase family enzyme
VDLTEAKKISVVGNSASGKSTLSRNLGKYLSINVYSIDKSYWLPGWQLKDKESFRLIHDKWLTLDSWIIEGVGYWEEMEDRISLSDIVIFMDVPVAVCKERAEIRIKEERLSPNPYITEGCIYNDMKERQMDVIEYFHQTLRPKLINYLSRFGQERVRVIRSYSELNIENGT